MSEKDVELRRLTISRALHRWALDNPEWFSPVENLISVDLKSCANRSQKSKIVIDWVKLCEAQAGKPVKEEIMKRYNR